MFTLRDPDKIMKHEACVNCGSTDFSLLDGYFFCNLCGSQSLSLREVEEEHTILTQPSLFRGLQKTSQNKISTRKKEFLVQKEVAQEEDTIDNIILLDRAVKKVDYPDFIRTVGLRLCTFTKLVSKISHILSNDFGVKSCCVEYSLWILHTYFREFGVAFHDDELAVRDKVFTAWKKKTMEEVKELKKEAKEARKRNEKETNEQKRSQLPIWEQITSQQLEELEHDHEEGTASQLEIAALAKFETKLSSDTIKAIDMILVLVFVSALLSGSKWIQLSDLFRWYREGRFGITLTQLNALDFATVWKKEQETKPIYKRTRKFYEAIQPSSENLRVMAFLTQFTGIPQNMKSLDFSKVLSRLVYTLNLPRVFLQHLDMILSFFPPVNVECGSSYFSSIIPLAHSVKEIFQNVESKKPEVYGPVSFFSRAFDEKYFYDTRRRWQVLSTEVKAAGLILFALKLFFGLDDKREYKFSPVVNEENDDLEAFNFIDWIQQLRLRMHVWQGKSIKLVTSKNFFADQTDTDDDKFHARAALSYAWFNERQRRDAFPKCVPNFLLNRYENRLFDDLLVNDLAKKTDSSQEALFTPLMFQAKNNEDYVEMISSGHEKILDNIDLKNVDVFYKSYVDNHMDFECTEKTNEILKTSAHSFGPDPADSCGCSKSEQFNQVFPCASAYLKFPVHNLPCLFVRLEANIQKVGRSVDANPVIANAMTRKLLMSDKRFFSNNFATLLRHFAITVCETEELLLLSFLISETLFFDHLRVRETEKNLRSGGDIQLDSKRGSLHLQESDCKDLPTHKLKFTLFSADSKTLITSLDPNVSPFNPVNEHLHLNRRSASSSEVSDESEDTSTDDDPVTAEKKFYKLISLPQSTALALISYRFW